MMRWILLGLALVAGCKGGQDQAAETPAAQASIGEVLATVNGQAIGSVDFESAAARETPADGKEFTLEERKKILDGLIAEELLYQEALKKGLDKDPKVKKVMVTTLLRDQVYANVRHSDFSEEELQKYYDAHKDEFVVPEKVQIRQISINVTEQRPDAQAKALAEKVRAEIAPDPKTKFKDAAASYSDDAMKRRGGDLGFIPREGKPGLDQTLVDKAFSMQVGELSEVFKTADGYHILYVANKRERLERTFDQMKGSVLRKVKNDKLKELYDQYVATLRTGATIEVSEDKLAAVEIKAGARRAGPGDLVNPMGDDDLELPTPEGVDAGLTPPAMPAVPTPPMPGAAEGGAEEKK